MISFLIAIPSSWLKVWLKQQKSRHPADLRSQALSKTYLHISRARTRLQHVLLTHYLIIDM